VVDHMQRK